MERRTFLLIGSGSLVLTSCTSTSSAPETGAASVPGPADSADPTAAVATSDEELRQRSGAAEVGLIVAYRAAIEAGEQPPGRLAKFLAHHVEHLARVAPELVLPDPTASFSGSAPTTQELARLEARARRLHEASCDMAQGPALARDLCLMAASEAQHVSRLRDLAGRSEDGA